MCGLLLANEGVNIKCGKYVINIRSRDQKYNYLQYRIEPFKCNLSKTDITDFEYEVNILSNFSEPETKPLAGMDDGYNPYRIYGTDTGYTWVTRKKDDIQHAYSITKDFSKWSLIIDNSNDYLSSFFNLSHIFSYSVIPKNGIVFHGIILEWNGRGILLCAHSGVGKTTHARLWRDYENALIINGDRALCCINNSRWYAFGCPWSGSSGEHINRSVPISAIVFINRSECNKVSEISRYKGALSLISHAFAPSWNTDMMSEALNTINNIVDSVPVYNLECTPDVDAVNTLKSVISKL